MYKARHQSIAVLLILSVIFLAIAPSFISASTLSPVSPRKSSPTPYRHKDVKKLVELTEKRDRHTKYYLNSDGSYTAETTINSRHYQDAQGKWQDISNRLVPSNEAGFAQQNEANYFYTKFANNPHSAPIPISGLN